MSHWIEKGQALLAWCQRRAGLVVAAGLALGLVCGGYAAQNFRINTDVTKLLDQDSLWRQNEMAFSRLFPQRDDLLVIVVEAPTGALAEQARAALLAELRAKHASQFRDMDVPPGEAFLRQHALYLMPPEMLSVTLDAMTMGQPFLAAVAAQPDLNGFLSAFNRGLQGLAMGEAGAQQIKPVMAALTISAQAALTGKAQPVNWPELFAQGSDLPAQDRMRFILAHPVLDYSALSAGEAAAQAVRESAQSLNLTPDHGIRVRLTGSVALANEEFASVAQDMDWAGAIAFALVVLWLVLALRSPRLVLALVVTLLVGLAMTFAFALAAVGALNVISIAFAVLFTGLAVDFGIQVGVRYRQCRYEMSDHKAALSLAVRQIAPPLTLAALGAAAGFLAFLPTSYIGVAELGLISGVGMLIAAALNLTFLPALICLMPPGPQTRPVQMQAVRPFEDWLSHHPRAVRRTALAVAVVAALGLMRLGFDVDPINLKDPRSESVSTLRDLIADPLVSPYVIDIPVAATQASALAARLRALPEVGEVRGLHDFLPDAAAQAQAQTLIADTRSLLEPSLVIAADHAPDLAAERARLAETVAALEALPAQNGQEQGKALAAVLRQGVLAGDGFVKTWRDSVVPGLLDQTRALTALLSAEPITPQGVPPQMNRDWISADEQTTRLEVRPKGDPRESRILRIFAESVLAVAPQATGMPISILGSGQTILGAFAEAAGLAFLAVLALLIFMLRQPLLVSKALLSLMLAGLVTLGSMGWLGWPLNLANIIALPLMLGLGVSFGVYIVTWWQQGHAHPLSASMGVAIIFSALTSLTAFGSLAASAHQGTASMGELLTACLVYTLVANLVILPALLGQSPKTGDTLP
ncbi:MAG: MMPL family transporter [Alphaproteobacteria bacterium]|nr:MAG: MMPL family transporter [Alphaproteobacteria bacterium]